MALEEEKDSIERKGHDGATVLLDGGWQKRGSGQNYNSLSGHVTIIGSETKKCVGFGVAKKSCRICKSSEKKGKLPTKHSCRRNYNGSSKGMESFLAVRGIKHLKNQGLKVKTVVMDDDSTTYSRIKKAFTDDLEKCSDKNHVAKNFTNELDKR
ncbi:uncharacterized protein LOC123559453 [Mercenaria mercenaria]|uniref:uncharacterized protein LOC123559453 n=1 Tax=Mercenaria mercenaria TaxID=6596 RepID=UPI00234F49D4|nr:uncharacterized protein LOC123559453 [Mercenaria mercenaria]